MIDYVWILLYFSHRIYVCRKNFVRLDQFFSPKDYRKNDKITYKHYMEKYGKS